MSRIVLGIGTGRCGTASLAALLNGQEDSSVSHEVRPLLPWNTDDRSTLVVQRINNFLRRRKSAVGDVASSYLPYIETFIAQVPEIRIVCMRRDRSEVIASFRRLMDRKFHGNVDHWSQTLQPGWFRDPTWSAVHPRFDAVDLNDALGKYWDYYNSEVDRLCSQYPDRMRIFSVDTLNTNDGQSRILDFCGFTHEKHVLMPCLRQNETPADAVQTASTESLASIVPGADKCAVLVPYHREIVPACEHALKLLETRGYKVVRHGGVSAIDLARSQMATQALRDGCLETLWIDSDVSFDVDAVEQLRRHSFPIVCGIYPKKGVQEFACFTMPGTQQLTFGKRGGVVEILYGATGFMLVRRQVYQDMQEKLNLSLCNEVFGREFVPFFQPITRPHNEGHWYLAEDYSFCERARQIGYSIMADTRIRLWHHGGYAYSWEDVCMKVERFESYTHNVR